MRPLYLKVYGDLLRRMRQYRHNELPLTGVLDLHAATTILEPSLTLKNAFKSGTASDMQAGFLALRNLSSQLHFLLRAEEHTRKALAQWRELQEQQQAQLPGWCTQAQQQQAQQLQQGQQQQVHSAVEQGDLYSRSLLEAALLLHRLHHANDLLLPGDEAEGDPQAIMQRVEAELQQLAAEVQQAMAAAGPAAGDEPASVPTSGGSLAAGSSGQAALEAASHAFFRRLRFRCDAMEWVYDGMELALLPHVLRARRGTPLLLALAFTLVGRRAGLPLVLQQATFDAAPPTAGQVPLEGQMPPDVAARQAGRTVAAAPVGPVWLVRAQLGGPGAEPLFVDVARRGEVASWQQAAGRYTQLQRELPGAGAQLLGLWRSLARSMVLGHQRRGESDAVGHWLYQLLALDATAPEWHLLRAGGS